MRGASKTPSSFHLDDIHLRSFSSTSLHCFLSIPHPVGPTTSTPLLAAAESPENLQAEISESAQISIRNPLLAFNHRHHRHRCIALILQHWPGGSHPSMATATASCHLGATLCARFYSNAATAAPSSPTSSAAASGEIGVQEFVKSIKGVEPHANKVAQAIIGVPTLLQTRSSRLKKLGIPCKQRKMIFRYTEKYRQGIWTPRMSTKQ